MSSVVDWEQEDSTNRPLGQQKKSKDKSTVTVSYIIIKLKLSITTAWQNKFIISLSSYAVTTEQLTRISTNWYGCSEENLFHFGSSLMRLWIKMEPQYKQDKKLGTHFNIMTLIHQNFLLYQWDVVGVCVLCQKWGNPLLFLHLLKIHCPYWPQF